MALENAASLSDPLALSACPANGAASSPLKVGPNTQLESGIPAAGQSEKSEGAPLCDLAPTLEAGVQRIEAALGDALRAEANLGMLMRGMKHLATSAQAALAANGELMHELDELRSHLKRSHEEEHALRFRMSQLERTLDVVRHETSSERAFIIEQQDLFLVEILTDHERQLSELRQRIRESSQSQLAVQQAEELIAQRDQAREYATRCERERDLAWQELASAAIAPTGDRIQRGPSGAAAIGAISLRSVSVPVVSAAPDVVSAAADTARSSERGATGYTLSGKELGE